MKIAMLTVCAVWAAGTVAGWAGSTRDTSQVILKKQEAVRTVIQMRRIEQRTIQEDQELKQMHRQLQEKLKARLAEKPEYQRLKKNLEELRRDLHAQGVTLKPCGKADIKTPPPEGAK